MAEQITNREHFKDTPLRDVESAFGDAREKGFNKGFESWLSFPYYKPEMHMVDGKMMLKGKEYKGYFYTNEEFAEYKRQGMIGRKEPICSFR